MKLLRVIVVLTVAFTAGVALVVFLALCSGDGSPETPGRHEASGGGAGVSLSVRAGGARDAGVPAVQRTPITGGDADDAPAAEQKPVAACEDEAVADEETVPGATGFSKDDLRRADESALVALQGGRGVVGDEIEIGVDMSLPALESCLLIICFDPDRLAYVPGSAKGLGGAFVAGLEAYSKAGSGRLILASRGIPGGKSVASVSRATVARFRVTARRSGRAVLTWNREKTQLVNSRGEPLAAVSLQNGEIWID